MRCGGKVDLSMGGTLSGRRSLNSRNAVRLSGWAIPSESKDSMALLYLPSLAKARALCLAAVIPGGHGLGCSLLP